MVDPSTAMFFAEADSKLTAPSTLCVTARVSMFVSECMSDLLATRVATVLVEALSEAVLVLDDVLLSVCIAATLFELLEDSANCEALLTDACWASCAAREEVWLVAN